MKPLAITITALILLIAGCGQPGPNPQVEAKRVEYAKSLRSYFDNANGDYSKLSESDKAAFVRLSGSESKAEMNWKLMKEGPGAASRGSQ